MKIVRIKRLHYFVLETFLSLFGATFSVCIFVLLMQFLWQYVNDMVAKGVGITILTKLFFYAALSFVPMAFPLSILLTSLITFGNLVERLELLAMKTSGISLFQIMKPLIFFAAIMIIVSLFCQNNIVPKAQTKMLTIVFSLKEKTPELDIPEKIFYKEIPGYNVYVRHKNIKNGMLYDVKIYDYSKGFEDAVVIIADSAKLSALTKRHHLVLTLYSGESFRNIDTNKLRNTNKILYWREKFGLRKILIDFDTNFKMKDESIMSKHDLNKNLNELLSCIKSIRQEQDSINSIIINCFKQNIYTFFKEMEFNHSTINTSSIKKIESYYKNLSINEKITCLKQAQNKAKKMQSDYYFLMLQQENLQTKLRSQYAYLYKKFSLAIACFLFLFIGVSLGTIVRKDGLGLAIVLSVAIFILYYTIDIFGTKLAKQGILTLEEGMWMSTFILIILSIFLTYQAINDSVIINR